MLRPLILRTLVTNLVLSAIGLLNSVLLSRWLGPAGRGEVAAAMLWPTLLVYLSSLGLISAILYFADRPKESLDLLKRNLRPVSPTDPAKITALIRALDSPRFAEREMATRDLGAFGSLVAKALADAEKASTSEEQRTRIQALLKAIEPWQPLVGDSLREFRSIAVLERIGNPEAISIIAQIAKGEPEARLTIEAAETLRRLAGRK